MTIPILSVKIFVPPPRPKLVHRPRLIERLNEGLRRKLTLVSASAGFGKTTLVSEWLADCDRPAAWLSLDDGDNDPARFLTCLIAALRTIRANIGESVFAALQSPQLPPIESILTVLLNEIAAIPNDFVLILDDYHVIESESVHNALSFLLEHLPPQMHLVLATRQVPPLPLARLRVRDQLIELRVADLRFTLSEASGFFNQVMSLNLSPEHIELLETRTEGWIAGLQLAAISMQGHTDAEDFIQSFTGSHHFVLDYLIEEVLNRQPASVQAFLLRTSILDRLCGPLCDAVMRGEAGGEGDYSSSTRSSIPPHNASSPSGQEMLTYLEQANLFIVPLDNERRWYRYHHLFADLLRQRLRQSAVSSGWNEGDSAAELHIRASAWYEEQGLEIEAFQHAAAANDIDRAARLMEGAGMPLHFRGGVTPVLNWLESLPATVLTEKPVLLVLYASALLMVGQMPKVEQKLQAAEAALPDDGKDEQTRDLIGHIAAIRATLAVSQYQADEILAQSRRALEYLRHDNLPVRTATNWARGFAFQLQGDRTAAAQAYTEAISISQSIGHIIIAVSASIGLGIVQEAENQLGLAADTYRHVLELVGDSPMPVSSEAHLGLARIFYEWNELDAAYQHAQKSLQLARQLENTDRFVVCDVLLARLQLAQGDAAGAAAILAKAVQLVRQHNFVHRISEVMAAQALTLLKQGNMEAAAHLARKHELPMSQARVHLAQGDSSAALAALEPLRRQAEEKRWEDERLKVMILQALALHVQGEKLKALQLLGDALALAEPGGYIRLFIDEGIPMARLLAEAAAHRMMPDYTGKLLALIEAENQINQADESDMSTDRPHAARRYAPGETRNDLRPAPLVQPLIEPLSGRELEILRLIAQGLSNTDISERLFLALSTVKGHNRNIYGKLQVQRRTEAVARARELGLLNPPQ